MLVIFGGLPAVGKTTLSRALAERLGAVYLRIDTIETAIAHSDLHAGETNAGYLAAYGIAKDNLCMRHTVVADSVNAIRVTRDAWREVARAAGVASVEIEVICSDISEHQRRVENRIADIEGHKLPTWQAIAARKYEAWESKNITIDTATQTPAEALEAILDLLSRTGGSL